MALRFIVAFSACVVLAQGSLLQSDIIGAEAEVPQEGYLPVEDAVEPHSLHHESGDVGHHHQGGHHYQLQAHHHEHGPHHHLESHHHLSESHHHHQESHHLIHGAPHHYQHHHLEAPHHHHHLEAPHHGVHGSHHHGVHHGVHHVHHHRNCHATIHCPRTHSPTYATDGHLCYHVENSCELAILNCLRRNELKPLLRHISGHECHHLPSARRSH
ncbi:hypothetical protein KR084_004237 [Drosophila pseudotakahashii]|nr:hypothetical protein KR084_004237 [Drosophila pseudotakahashii]